MKYLRMSIHIIVECFLHPIEDADLYFDDKGNIIGRYKV
jgi:hypothetical protein